MAHASTCTFASPRGHELSARIEHPDGPVHATAVFAHCFTCSKDLRSARTLARALADRGIAVLSFDFAGVGSSDGTVAESTVSRDVDDLVAAAGYLRETLQAPTLLVGHSLGGAAVLLAARRLDGVEAVATIGAPSDLEHLTDLFADDLDEIEERGEAEVALAGRSFTLRRDFVDDLRDHSVVDAVADLGAAVLLLHAPMDNTVGIEHAAALFRAARHPRSFVSLADADHLMSDPDDAHYAAEVVAAWATRYLPEVPSRGASTAGSYADKGAVAVTREGLRTEVTTRGFRLQVDEPASAGGTETGPTPYDQLAAALASCTSMTLRMYADRKALPLESARTTVTFDRVHADDCAHCDTEDGRIELFTRTVELTGDLDDDSRTRLLEIANRCPVHRTLEGAIEVHTEGG